MVRRRSLLVLASLLAAGSAAAAARAGGWTPIARSRAASPLFRIFPAHAGTRSCAIPRGGPYSPGHMWVPGRCSTVARAVSGYSGMTVVAFTERWDGMSRFDPRHARRHAWRVTVTATGKVVAIRESGAAAPQSWA